MRKIIKVVIVISLFFSCGPDKDFYQEGKYYKLVKEGQEGVYITFLNDTILAHNSNNLKNCSWTMTNFKKSKIGLYLTQGLELDTIWVKPSKEGFTISESGIMRDTVDLKYEKFELMDARKDSVIIDLKIIRRFSEKGIRPSCDFSLKQSAYFYEEAVAQIKARLKYPNEAKFNQAYFDRYSFTNKQGDFVSSTSYQVTLDVDTMNGMGILSESNYYVFFIPQEADSTKYDAEFSKSISLMSDSRKRLKEYKPKP